MLPIVINFLLAINIIVSLLIVLLVLMQRPKNEGLGAAFGGGMTENLFGAQTSNVLQTITRWLGGIFFALTLLLSWLYVKKDFNRSSLQQRLSAPTVIPATPAPVIPQDVPTSLPGATSAPVKPGDAPANPELEKISDAIKDAVKAKATPAPGATAPATPEGAKPAPAPGAAPAPAPEASKSSPAPEGAPAAPVPAPEAPKPAPAAPEAAKPAPAPEGASAAASEAAKPAPAPEAAKPAEAPAPAPAPAAPQQ